MLYIKKIGLWYPHKLQLAGIVNREINVEKLNLIKLNRRLKPIARDIEFQNGVVLAKWAWLFLGKFRG